MKKEKEAYRKNQREDLRAAMSRKPEPDRAVLEAALEAREKCGKCGGKIRAMCDAEEKLTGPSTFDTEVHTTLYCRTPSCGWSVTQFRPWSSSKPEEI